MKHYGSSFEFVKNSNYNMMLLLDDRHWKMISKHKTCLTFMCFHVISNSSIYLTTFSLIVLRLSNSRFYNLQQALFQGAISSKQVFFQVEV
jgi:hypothetical protein